MVFHAGVWEEGKDIDSSHDQLPDHAVLPLTKGQKRQCGVDLLGYVRSQGLVVGGEHGDRVEV
jgi:hypothetical protein